MNVCARPARSACLSPAFRRARLPPLIRESSRKVEVARYERAQGAPRREPTGAGGAAQTFRDPSLATLVGLIAHSPNKSTWQTLRESRSVGFVRPGQTPCGVSSTAGPDSRPANDRLIRRHAPGLARPRIALTATMHEMIPVRNKVFLHSCGAARSGVAFSHVRNRRPLRKIAGGRRPPRRAPRRACSPSSATAGPIAPASRSTAIRRASGWTQALALRRDRALRLGRAARRARAARSAASPASRCAPATRVVSVPAERRVRDRLAAARPPRAARDERRRRRSRSTRRWAAPSSFAERFAPRRRCRAATRSATRAWPPRAASRPSTRTRSRPASTSASCTTARSRTTTACAASCAARASPSRPTTTPRSPPAT